VNFPASGLEASPFVLVAIGFAVGLLGGAFGVGGGFLAGPALYLLGMPLRFVVGTDLALIAGHSLVAARHHHALGNVDLRLALALTPATVVGVELGARTLEALKRRGAVDVIAMAYALLLVALAVFLLLEGRGRKREKPAGEGLLSGLPPHLHLKVARMKGSVVAILAIGLAIGFMGGLLGAGGGSLRMPALVFLLGVPTPVAVGTDLFEVIVSATYGAFTHALKGNVDFLAALVMQAGGVVGARFGARLTTKVRGVTLRRAFAPIPLIGAGLIVWRLLGRPEL